MKKFAIAPAAWMAMSALVALATVSSAQGGPEPSRFAGTYLWGTGSVPIAISEDGQISSSFLDVSGRVRADGTYSFTVTESGVIDPDDRGRGRKFWKVTNRYTGIMTLDDEGNAVGTPTAGDSFVWLRQ